MAEIYRFGRFTLETAERRLCADGDPVLLGFTDFRLLLALVESAGTVVAKEDLMSRVWGRSVVGDHVLYVHVNTLRKILGDDFIVNKQGRGYRFAAPVQRDEASVVRATAEERLGNLSCLSRAKASDGPSRLIGREAQLQLISDLLARGRLVTLTGPGGVGKTRLALVSATDAETHYPDGAWAVELAGLDDGDLVPAAIATTFGLKISGTATPLAALSHYLARKSLLLVLDNCEHVRASAALVVETLLRSSPDLYILATSREPISCADEQILEVPPLALPVERETEPELLRSAAAVELFMERARAADATFRVSDSGLGLAARICRRVDGLPLAIEMAAAWAGALGLEALEAKLAGSISALHARSTAPSRHSTLRATLEWSYDLLSMPEQTVLRRLAVFAGSFSLEAAEDVAGDETLPAERIFEHVASLVQKSMIAVIAGSRVQRYRLLETTRTFMREKLAAEEDAQPTRQRHSRYLRGVLERAKCELETTSDAVWLVRYSPFVDDLRVALDWATLEDCEEAVALAGASPPLWRVLSLRSEGGERLAAVASRLRSDTPPALEARLRDGLGEMRMNTAQTRLALEDTERAVSLYRIAGERAELGAALTRLAHAQFMLGHLDRAEDAINESLSLLEPLARPRTRALAYGAQLYIEASLGRHDKARSAGEMAARLAATAGAEGIGVTAAGNLVEVLIDMGNIEEGISAARHLAAQLGNTRHVLVRGFVLGLLSVGLTLQGELEEALAAAREAAPLLHSEGFLLWFFDHLALRAVLCGRAKDAALIEGYAEAAFEKYGRWREPIGRRAAKRTASLLRKTLPADEIAGLGRIGAQLSEDQTLELALR